MKKEERPSQNRKVIEFRLDNVQCHCKLRVVRRNLLQVTSFIAFISHGRKNDVS